MNTPKDLVLSDADQLIADNVARLFEVAPELLDLDHCHAWTIAHAGELFAQMEREHTGY